MGFKYILWVILWTGHMLVGERKREETHLFSTKISVDLCPHLEGGGIS